MTDLPPHLRPFVLPHEAVDPVRAGHLDLYLPSATPAPAVLLVHGGPVRPDRPVRPPEWPAYRGYGALLARAGLVGVMVEHGFTDEDSLDRAHADVSAAVEALRTDRRVDPDRLGLWFFSVGGLLMGSFLRSVPPGVRAVAGTYAAVAAPDYVRSDLPQAVDAAPTSAVPLLLVRPEEEFDWIEEGTDELLRRAGGEGREVEVLDVPGCQHGFETVDDNDAARAAIRDSVAWFAQRLDPGATA